LVVCLLSMAALWVSKIKNRRQKHRSGQNTLARQNNIQKITHNIIPIINGRLKRSSGRHTLARQINIQKKHYPHNVAAPSTRLKVYHRDNCSYIMDPPWWIPQQQERIPLHGSGPVREPRIPTTATATTSPCCEPPTAWCGATVCPG
jgi:hypothetical protein